MATTSSNLTAGTAIIGQNSNGKGSKGRVAGLLATAALGLGLLVGATIMPGRQAAAPATSQAGAPALAGARPVDAAVAADYRWDFDGVATTGPVATALAQGPALAPADASTSAEYRWDFAR